MFSHLSVCLSVFHRPKKKVTDGSFFSEIVSVYQKWADWTMIRCSLWCGSTFLVWTVCFFCIYSTNVFENNKISICPFCPEMVSPVLTKFSVIGIDPTLSQGSIYWKMSCQAISTSFDLHCCSKVHARNILRALYKETKLGEDVYPYVAEGVQVAVEGFLSDSWAVSSF